MKHDLAPNYECFVIKYKLIRRKTRNAYKMISHKHFRKISFVGGLYEAGECAMYGCFMADGQRKFTGLFNKKTEFAIGVSQVWAGEFTFCCVRKRERAVIKKRMIPGNLSLYNSPAFVELKFSTSPVSRFLLDELLELHKSNSFKNDLSIESSHEWGPISRMIPGFKQVKTGIVQKDDYYWDDHNGDGHWVRCDVSFSPIRVGAKIERRSILFVDERVKPASRKTFRYYNQFVIRKNS